jgi:NAD(P)-dependent dehydrogenase (short-subunit alcohol dehydrogenase family)
MLRLALVAFSCLSAARPDATQDPPAPTPAVLVTGASSGLGRKTTELLAQSGYFVYATARKPADLAELGKLANVQAVPLDVTQQDQIDQAVAVVRAGGRPLHGIVCNAGIAVMAPLIELHERDLQQQFDVNVFGTWRVAKAFAPLLLEHQGRIAITGSLSGTVNWALGGPYTMSKHAVEAMTDVLALELNPLGVQVSVIEPGNYRSEIMQGMQQRLRTSGYGGEGSRWRRQIERLQTQPSDRTQYPEPDDVAKAFLAALRDTTPKRRYLVVPNQREAELTIRAALQRVVELNQDQPFAYDRDTLVKLLDEALRARRQ